MEAEESMALEAVTKLQLVKTPQTEMHAVVSCGVRKLAIVS